VNTGEQPALQSLNTQGKRRLRFQCMNSLIWFAILLIVIWVVARLFLAVTSAMLHLLWIIGVILFIIWLVKRVA
jgi:uncharacterized membrane protein